MSNEKNPVIICEEDYKKFSTLLNIKQNSIAADDMSLAAEISRATVVKDDELPPHTIRIGSNVSVVDVEANREMDFELVMPEHANSKEKKISILSPMAAAIIGFKQGDNVEWKMPSGLKKLKIARVENG